MVPGAELPDLSDAEWTDMYKAMLGLNELDDIFYGSQRQVRMYVSVFECVSLCAHAACAYASASAGVRTCVRVLVCVSSTRGSCAVIRGQGMVKLYLVRSCQPPTAQCDQTSHLQFHRDESRFT